MGWATSHIESCDEAGGYSMSGKIDSGQLYTVLPVVIEDLEVEDIVLCKVNLREHGAKRCSELLPSIST